LWRKTARGRRYNRARRTPELEQSARLFSLPAQADTTTPASCSQSLQQAGVHAIPEMILQFAATQHHF
jgi:hypothetical protein